MRLDGFGIFVEDMAKMIRFYRDVLGFEIREVGIASNRRSACCGEYVPGPCTHRPSHHGS